MRNKNTLIIFLLTAIVLSIFTLSNTNALGSGGLSSAMEMFTTYDAVDINRNKETPLTANLNDGKKGVLLSTSKEGANVRLSPTMSGNFEIDFRVYSDESYSGTNWADANYVNNALDLKEIAFKITDVKTGRHFTIYITGGERWNVITPVARVVTGDSIAGLHYNGDAVVENDTVNKNREGFFTRMWGTTFSNVARTSGKLTSEDSKSTIIGFDPNSMQVYGYHYGASASKFEKRIIVDLNDGRFLGENDFQKGYQNFNVDMIFSSISAGKRAKVIVYSINNQSLAGNALQNTSGPELYAHFNAKGVIGDSIMLPKPTAYDIIDGNIGFKGTVSVKNSKGNNIEILGTTSNVFKEGCCFIPQFADTYYISYTGTDLSGVKGRELVLPLEVVSARPDSEFIIQKDYREISGKDIVIGAGTEHLLYPAYFKNILSVDNENFQASLTITKDGNAVKGYEEISIKTPEPFIFKEEGVYKLIYSVPNCYAVKDTKKFEVFVSKSVVAFSRVEIASVIPKGNQLELPKVKAYYEGNEIDAVSYLMLPDGTQLSQPSIKLEQLGDYELIFKATLSNTDFYMKKYFSVAIAPNTLFSMVSDCVIEENVNTPFYFSGRNGVKITGFEEQATVKYNNTVNISNNTKNDKLLELLITPSDIGKEDFFELIITLTDVNDLSNYVRISIYKGSWGNHVSYLKTGATGQRMAGLEKGKVNTGYNVGTPINNSFTGEGRGNTVSIAFDYANKAVHAYPSYYAEDGGLIAKLDDPNHFSKNTLWNGFSTGEVSISMTMLSLQTVSASYIVLNVNGNNLSGNWIEDTTAPDIFVDFDGYSINSLPSGVVNKPYKLFDAKAYDKLDGVIPNITKEVYKNYGTEDSKKYLVTDDKFLPDEQGAYSIVYMAKDGSSNVSKQVVNIQVKQDLPPITLQLREELPKNSFVGKTVTIPDYLVSGGSGKKDVEVFIKTPDNPEFTSIKGSYYNPLIQGNYQIVFKVSDYLESVNFVYDQIVTISKSPIIVAPIFPNFMIDGMNIQIPKCEAIDYYSDIKNPMPAYIKIFAYYNGTTTEISEDFMFKPNVINDGDIVVIRYTAYSVFDMDFYSVLEMDVSVKKVRDEADNLRVEKYFVYSENVNVQVNEESLLFNTASSNEKITFIKELTANAFSVRFNVPIEYNNLDYVMVTMTDLLDASLKLQFKIYKNSVQTANYSYVTLNDGERVNIAGSFYSNSLINFEILYDNISYTIRDATQKILMTIETLNGKKFNGFTSGKIKLDLQFGNITPDKVGGLELKMIGNQIFGNIDADYSSPIIQLEKEIVMTYQINSDIVIPAANSLDILDTFVELTVSAECPDGSMVIRRKPIDKELTFKSTQYGDYTIAYTAMDGSGQRKVLTFKINVRDMIPPVLSINGDLPQKIKVNTTLNLPSAVASDNHTENLKIYIFIITPQNNIINCSGNTYEIKEKGSYTIRYYVRDDAENYVIKDFEVVAE